MFDLIPTALVAVSLLVLGVGCLRERRRLKRLTAEYESAVATQIERAKAHRDLIRI